MCIPLIPAVIAGAALAGGGLAYAGASKQASATKVAARQAESSAQRQAQRAETAFNKANQKTPNVAALMDANAKSAAGGIGSTFLTGVSGAAPGALARTSLLGG